MKTFYSLFIGIGFSASLLFAKPPPSGQVVELHACELYTGGCTASAQSTLGGRSLLRVWSFENGARDGVDLAGLQIAVLETANANLAFTDTRSSNAVIYLPKSASPEKRAALTNWLRNSQPSLATVKCEERMVEMNFVRDGGRITVKIGDRISLQTRELEHCDAGGCGEQLWYSPRTETSRFTVLVNDRSSISEPALALTWKDHGVKTVFLGEFGNQPKADPAFSLALSE